MSHLISSAHHIIQKTVINSICVLVNITKIIKASILSFETSAGFINIKWNMLSDIKTKHGFVLCFVGISFNLSSWNWCKGYDFSCPIDSAMNLNVEILHVTQINPNFWTQLNLITFITLILPGTLIWLSYFCVQKISLKGQRGTLFILLKYGFES